jgi:hypothetical protein
VRKSYVMVFAPALASSVKDLTAILDHLDPQCDWHSPMGSCLFFTSHSSANDIAREIESRLGVGPGKLYLITEYSSNSQGRLPDRGWRLLGNPENPRGA